VVVVIGNYFRAGQLPALTDDAKAEIAKHAEQQLENVYAVRVVDAKMGNVQGIELMLTKR
jgi:transposase-like protein